MPDDGLFRPREPDPPDRLRIAVIVAFIANVALWVLIIVAFFLALHVGASAYQRQQYDCAGDACQGASQHRQYQLCVIRARTPVCQDRRGLCLAHIQFHPSTMSGSNLT